MTALTKELRKLQRRLEAMADSKCVEGIALNKNECVALLALLDQHQPALTDEPYNGPLSGRGVITDEARREMVALLSDLEEDPSYHWFEQWGTKMGKLAGKIRALIQSPPKVSVTREWLAKLGEHFIYIQIDEAKAMLAERGIAVVDKSEEGKKQAD